MPVAAWTWAMPWPINPAPATKTRPMGCAMASMVRGRPSPMRPTPGGVGPLRPIDLVDQPVRGGDRIEAMARRPRRRAPRSGRACAAAEPRRARGGRRSRGPGSRRGRDAPRTSSPSARPPGVDGAREQRRDSLTGRCGREQDVRGGLPGPDVAIVGVGARPGATSIARSGCARPARRQADRPC